MPKQLGNEARRLLQLAEGLRKNARVATLPGYSEQLIRAAERLEERALERELRLVADNKPR